VQLGLIVIGYELDDRGSRPDSGRKLASYHTPGSVQGLTSPRLSSGCRQLFPARLKRPCCQTDESLVSSGEGKDVWSYSRRWVVVN